MQFGAHESIAGGVSAAIERGVVATCDTIQIFNKSNQQWKAKVLSEPELDEYYCAMEQTGISVACSHASYLINVGSPERSLREKSRRALRQEVLRCSRLRIPNLVFHPGAHVGSGEASGVKRIAEGVNWVLSNTQGNDVCLCLETTAGAGTTLGHTFEQLGEMIGRVDDQAHVGVCLDTCHIFAAGYELKGRAGYLKTIRAFDAAIGLDRLKVLHLNDSKHERGSRKDRHEHIGKGSIGLEGFRHVVNDRRLKHLPMVLETPKGVDLAEDVENLKVLRSLVGNRRRAGRNRE